jgi:tetratricopeptide (TPR) repeat protein
VREILPWLRLSAELDPQRVETYTVTAYWLRQRMGKVDEAEQFLRDGLRANPNSYEILYELGRVCAENRNDPLRARNLWEAAMRQWQKQDSAGFKPDTFLIVQILSHLAMLEAKLGDYTPAITHMELWKKYSPTPDQVEKRIEELKQQRSAPASGAATDNLPTRTAEPATRQPPVNTPLKSTAAGSSHAAAPETGVLR